MADAEERQGPDLGLFHNASPTRSRTSLIAVGLSAVWIVVTGAVLLFGGGGEDGGDPLRLILGVIAVFLPVAVIWIGAVTADSAAAVRGEAARLRATVDTMRQSYLSQNRGVSEPGLQKRLDEIAAAQKKTQTALATFASIRTATPPPAPESTAPAARDEQPTLALPDQAEDRAPPLSNADLIGALQFPQTPDDVDGFRTLRRAMQDRQAAQLITAAQDVLTLLSQDGVYMDDLDPDRARPDVWRRFAAGERGRAIATLGGVRDRETLARTVTRMRKDTIFRDAAHHFLRRFDQVFADWAPNATDTEIADLADTRTARAFMLLGRVTGTFD